MMQVRTWSNEVIETTGIMKFFEGDHLRLDLLFANYMKCKNKTPEQAKLCFEQFKQALQQHMVWEDEILFPIFQEKTDMEGPIQVLRLEHRQITTLLNTLYKKVKNSDPTSEIEEYKLLSLLGDHSLKEEMIVFPAIESAVTKEEVDEIFAAMNRMPQGVYETGGH
jgi:iron-sulfur cluster repair protein YtfE (RIC family)